MTTWSKSYAFPETFLNATHMYLRCPGASLAIAVAFWLMISGGQILAQEKTAGALDLVLAIDCSASIDAEKFDIQLHGLASSPEQRLSRYHYFPRSMPEGEARWDPMDNSRSVPLSHALRVG